MGSAVTFTRHSSGEKVLAQTTFEVRDDVASLSLSRLSCRGTDYQTQLGPPSDRPVRLVGLIAGAPNFRCVVLLYSITIYGGSKYSCVRIKYRASKYILVRQFSTTK